MTLYEKWCGLSPPEQRRLRFNLKKHTCTFKVDPDITGALLIADTENWIDDIHKLYKAYAQCIPPESCRGLNFIPARLKDHKAITLTEDFDRARIALEAYVYLHWLKGDIVWNDENGFYVPVCRNCVITKQAVCAL